ncbi:MAG: AAA family ATPase [Synergistaceae bacterium]|nr:AAA family ATPase [Synergistaceae bacterium]
MKVVSVINYKGGVGKTTLTANLGAYAAFAGRRVLMIDLDPQSHLAFRFMTPEEWRDKYADTKTLLSYFEPLTRGADEAVDLSSLVIPLNMGDLLNLQGLKLGLISSHLNMIDIDMQLAGLVSAPTQIMLAANSLKTCSYLRNQLDKMKDEYDLVLLDCPPNFYLLVKNAVVASNYYIVPAKLDYLSTLGVMELQKKIEAYLRQYEEYRVLLGEGRYRPVFLTAFGIVPMMVNIHKGDEPISAEREYMKVMKDNGHYIFHFVRNNSSVFGAAPFDGVPAVLTRPRFNLTARRIVREMQELGEEFLGRLGI